MGAQGAGRNSAGRAVLLCLCRWDAATGPRLEPANKTRQRPILCRPLACFLLLDKGMEAFCRGADHSKDMPAGGNGPLRAPVETEWNFLATDTGRAALSPVFMGQTGLHDRGYAVEDQQEAYQGAQCEQVCNGIKKGEETDDRHQDAQRGQPSPASHA